LHWKFGGFDAKIKKERENNGKKKVVVIKLEVNQLHASYRDGRVITTILMPP
jgi:hypothetical protein